MIANETKLKDGSCLNDQDKSENWGKYRGKNVIWQREENYTAKSTVAHFFFFFSIFEGGLVVGLT